VLVLAVAGVTTYGVVSMKHSAGPSKRQAAKSSQARASSSSPSSPVEYGGETVVLWWVGAQKGILNIADDLINISRAGVNDDVGRLGTEFTDGISTDNTSELEQIEPEIEDASSQIQKMYASLDNYLPPGTVTEP
jgi:hypothetical protein